VNGILLDDLDVPPNLLDVVFHGRRAGVDGGQNFQYVLHRRRLGGPCFWTRGKRPPIHEREDETSKLAMTSKPIE